MKRLFLKSLPPNPELDALFAEAKTRPTSEAELCAQGISWSLGEGGAAVAKVVIEKLDRGAHEYAGLTPEMCRSIRARAEQMVRENTLPLPD